MVAFERIVALCFLRLLSDLFVPVLAWFRLIIIARSFAACAGAFGLPLLAALIAAFAEREALVPILALQIAAPVILFLSVVRREAPSRIL